MAFTTKITFVPRDNGQRTISCDNVDYGITGPSRSVFHSVKEEYAFLNFRSIESNGYYDFIAVLSFEEFLDFHKKYFNDTFNGAELKSFLHSAALQIRYNWVLIIVYEWESGLG